MVSRQLTALLSIAGLIFVLNSVNAQYRGEVVEPLNQQPETRGRGISQLSRDIATRGTQSTVQTQSRGSPSQNQVDQPAHDSLHSEGTTQNTVKENNQQLLTLSQQNSVSRQPSLLELLLGAVTNTQQPQARQLQTQLSFQQPLPNTLNTQLNFQQTQPSTHGSQFNQQQYILVPLRLNSVQPHPQTNIQQVQLSPQQTTDLTSSNFASQLSLPQTALNRLPTSSIALPSQVSLNNNQPNNQPQRLSFASLLNNGQQSSVANQANKPALSQPTLTATQQNGYAQPSQSEPSTFGTLFSQGSLNNNQLNNQQLQHQLQQPSSVSLLNNGQQVNAANQGNNVGPSQPSLTATQGNRNAQPSQSEPSTFVTLFNAGLTCLSLFLDALLSIGQSTTSLQRTQGFSIPQVNQIRTNLLQTNIGQQTTNQAQLTLLRAIANPQHTRSNTALSQTLPITTRVSSQAQLIGNLYGRRASTNAQGANVQRAFSQVMAPQQQRISNTRRQALQGLLGKNPSCTYLLFIVIVILKKHMYLYQSLPRALPYIGLAGLPYFSNCFKSNCILPQFYVHSLAIMFHMIAHFPFSL